MRNNGCMEGLQVTVGFFPVVGEVKFRDQSEGIPRVIFFSVGQFRQSLIPNCDIEAFDHELRISHVNEVLFHGYSMFYVNRSIRRYPSDS